MPLGELTDDSALGSLEALDELVSAQPPAKPSPPQQQQGPQQRTSFSTESFTAPSSFETVMSSATDLPSFGDIDTILDAHLSTSSAQDEMTVVAGAEWGEIFKTKRHAHFKMTMQQVMDMSRESGRPSLTNALDDFAFFERADLAPPGWPAGLPSPRTTRRIVESFYDKRFMFSWLKLADIRPALRTLPPMHAHFPHPSLLHAIIATVLADELLSGSGVDIFADDLGANTGIPHWTAASSPQEWHEHRALDALDEALEKADRRGAHALMALMLLIKLAHSRLQFGFVWLWIGRATRIATLLGLERLLDPAPSRRAIPGSQSVAIAKDGVLPPPATVTELQERQALVWWVYAYDVQASCTTLWPKTLNEDMIRTPLPAFNPELALTSTTEQEECLLPTSLSFFMTHPPHLVGAPQLYMKSMILLGRALTFVTRLPMPIGRTLVSEPILATDVARSDRFTRLQQEITMFLISIPDYYRDVVWRRSSVKQATLPPGTDEHTYAWDRLILLNALAARILLYENLLTPADLVRESVERDDQTSEADFSTDTVPSRHCLFAANAVIQTVRKCPLAITSAEREVQALVSQSWVVAARVCVKRVAMHEHAARLGKLKLDLDELEHLLAKTYFVIACLRSFGTPFEDNAARTLEMIIQRRNVRTHSPRLWREADSRRPSQLSLPDESVYEWPSPPTTTSAEPSPASVSTGAGTDNNSSVGSAAAAAKVMSEGDRYSLSLLQAEQQSRSSNVFTSTVVEIN